jgi:hypothetical protein
MLNLDDIFLQFIVDKLNEIKSDPTILDLALSGKTIDQINSVKQFITSNMIPNQDIPVRVVMHHPRDAADLPCYSIVLESQNEDEQMIGSSGASEEIAISKMSDGWIGSDSEIFINNIPTEEAYEARGIIYDVPKTLTQTYSSLVTKDGRRVCHMTGQQDNSATKGVFIDFQHSLIHGGYISLASVNSVSFMVKSNRIGSWLQFGFGTQAHGEHVFTANITARNMWQKVTVSLSGIDISDLTNIRYMSFVILDDSQPTDIYIDELMGENALGTTYNETLFNNLYRIEIWTSNADLTLNLYSILLWLMLRYRDIFESSYPIWEMRVEGGDIIPQPEWLPEVVYIRSLSISCKSVEVVPRETDLTALTVLVGRTDFSG